MNDSNTPAARRSIETKGLTKSFGSQKALRDISLAIGEGEQLVVFGPNGAGKTTLIKILATLQRPSGGNAWINGIDIRSNPVQIRQCVGIVSHQTFLYNDLTVYENLKFYGKMYDVSDLEERIHSVTDYVQLGPRLHDRTGTLSRGLQQRASIARAIIHNPAVMLLDEPEVGLDAQAIDLMRQFLDTFAAGGGAAVITTHNLERGLELSDRAVILNRGRIVYQERLSGKDIDGFREVYQKHTGAGA